MTDVDAVVIGSGAGGLTAALAMAIAGQRVLVLEQHYLPGGWCHSFDLGGYSFSPGVHYIGDLGPGGRLRGVYEGLGVADDLVFLELDPDGYDKVQVGQERFAIPKGRDRFVDRLIDRFPSEAKGIRRFVQIVADLSRELHQELKIRGPLSALSLPLRCPTLVRFGFRSVKQVLERFIRDPTLRTILSVQAGDHGMSTDQCPMVLHAAVLAHYFDGAYYPKGGARALPKAFIKALRRHGGDIQVRAQVSRILTERGRAIGVRLADGSEIRARHIISNADPAMTFGQLLDPSDVPRGLARRRDGSSYSVSAISLFMAADIDARAAGLDSGNRWYVRTPDVDATYRYARSADPLASGEVPGIFLTCTTCKDPSKRKRGMETMEVFSFVSWEAFAPFAESDHDTRPPEYLALKDELARRMLSCVDEVVPGLSDRLTFLEVGTPLTNQFYCASHRGNLYGTEKRLRQLGPLGFPIDPKIEGLYLCGQSTTGHGVAGATYSGLAAARAALGVRTSELLREHSAPLQIWPCDRPEEWPDGGREATA